MFNGKSLSPFKKDLKKLVKRRTLNTKNNRVYVQDSELAKLTEFKPGVALECLLDTNTNKLTIKPSENGSLRVAKRVRKDSVGSVIDIRKKNILEMFRDYDLLDLVIYEDEIIVTGLNKVESNPSENCSNVVSFNDAYEQKEIISIDKQELVDLSNHLYLKCAGDNFPNNIQNNQKLNSGISKFASSLANNRFVAHHSLSDIGPTSLFENVVRVASVCAGAGLLDKGFKDEGFDLVFALELENDMVETYRYNLGNHVIQGDLSKYPVSEIPDAEVFIGGIPCHEYSQANRITGKVLDHPKNLLIRNFMEIAESMNSLKVFVIENVPQILTKGRKFIEELKERMSDFDITIKVVDSSKYGCAQKRERAIIIGSKIGPIDLPDYVLAPVRTVRDAFRSITPDTPNQKDFSKPKDETLKRIGYVQQGGNWRDIPEDLRTKGSHSNLFYRLAWDTVCKTITNVRKSMILHPEEDRILSVRECATLFGLDPDENGNVFTFKGSLSNMQQMIANAVPLEISRTVAKTIKEQFLKFFGKSVSFL